MDKTRLIKLSLNIESIIIGERFKGGVFRPCQDTIPSSTIEGALKHYFGIKVPAVGFFIEGTYEYGEFIYSVKDKFLNTSKMPIITSYLKPKHRGESIKAEVYIPYSKGAELKDIEEVEIQLGALKSKGFGNAKIVKVEEVDSEIFQGILKVKLFKNEAEEFQIRAISPIYGYLFKPDDFSIGGAYKKSLFPGSMVEGPDVFLKEVTYYDK